MRWTHALALALLLATPSFAQTTSEATAPSAPDAWDQNPFRLFAGGAAGYGNVSGDEFSKAADGPQALLGADLAYEPEHYVIEAGAGWLYSKLDGALANSSTISVRTRSGFFDASARYRLTKHWQIGPAYNLAFGTDTSFSPGVGDSNATSLLGARVVYETGIGIFPLRIIGQTLAAVGDGGRSYILATLGFQFGIQIPPTAHSEAASKPIAEAPIHVTSAATIRVELDPRLVFFHTNSSEVRPEVASILHDIGAYLSQHDDAWTHINVSGHADQRGRAAYNMRLSDRRALSVEKEIEAAGANTAKIDHEAFGFTQLADPHNNRQAWAKNRRVVLTIDGVTDATGLAGRINELSKFEIGRNP